MEGCFGLIYFASRGLLILLYWLPFLSFLPFSLSNWSGLVCLKSCTVCGCLFKGSWRLKVHEVHVLFSCYSSLIVTGMDKLSFSHLLKNCTFCCKAFSCGWMLRIHKVLLCTLSMESCVPETSTNKNRKIAPKLR